MPNVWMCSEDKREMEKNFMCVISEKMNLHEQTRVSEKEASTFHKFVNDNILRHAY